MKTWTTGVSRTGADRTPPNSGPRRRRGVTLLEIVGVVGMTTLVLSTTSVAIYRVSQLNHHFKDVGLDQTNRHRTFRELREKIHAAEHVELTTPQKALLRASRWPEDLQWDLEQLPVLSHWNWSIPTRWRLEAGMLQIVDDRPGIESPDVLFEAAVGITVPRTPPPLLPPLETLP